MEVVRGNGNVHSMKDKRRGDDDNDDDDEWISQLWREILPR